MRWFAILVVALGCDVANYQYVRPFCTAPAGGPTIVAPIGTSIDRGAVAVLPSGFVYHGGWRSTAFAAMTTAGMNPDFRGDQLNSAESPAVTTAGLSHGGHNGSDSKQWRDSIFATWQAALAVTPHVVAIGLGANDPDNVTYAGYYGEVIDLIAAAYPRAMILCGTRTRQWPASLGQTWVTQVALEVSTRRARGMHVKYVDLWDGLGTGYASLLSDGLHFTDAGYVALGNVWGRELVSLNGGATY